MGTAETSTGLFTRQDSELSFAMCKAAGPSSCRMPEIATWRRYKVSTQKFTKSGTKAIVSDARNAMFERLDV